MTRETFIAWHGSPCEFARFDFSKLRDALGVFFTANREAAEYYGTARQYRLSFRNLLRVRQGAEYARWVAKREGETDCDVRRLVKVRGGGRRIPCGRMRSICLCLALMEQENGKDGKH